MEKRMAVSSKGTGREAVRNSQTTGIAMVYKSIFAGND